MSNDQINELDNEGNVDHGENENEDDVDSERLRLIINGMSHESIKRIKTKIEQQIDKKQCEYLICSFLKNYSKRKRKRKEFVFIF